MEKLIDRVFMLAIAWIVLYGMYVIAMEGGPGL